MKASQKGPKGGISILIKLIYIRRAYLPPHNTVAARHELPLFTSDIRVEVAESIRAERRKKRAESAALTGKFYVRFSPVTRRFRVPSRVLISLKSTRHGC
jgi:hypothetical protein